MNTKLPEYLRDMASRQFIYGETDCAMFCAEWVKVSSGVDLTFGQRARDEEHAGHITRGDLLAFASGQCFAAGLEETDAPLRGDIGVIEINGQPTCGIKTDGKWAVKTAVGVKRIADEFVTCLAAWSVPVKDEDIA